MNEIWHVIPCPSTVTLTNIQKERGTHGSVYCLWECEKRTPVWVGQSIPALVRSINDKAVVTAEKRLHASSLYRCLRREARKESHKNWKVNKFARSEISELNQHLLQFPSTIYCSKSPELWRCERSEKDLEATPSTNSPVQASVRKTNSFGTLTCLADDNTVSSTSSICSEEIIINSSHNPLLCPSK